MFEYLEPDASEASNLPPSSHNTSQPRPERLRHLLYGSRAATDRTIKILHSYGYADPNDWSDPIPVPPSGAETGLSSGVGTWMVILTKTLLIE